MRAGKSLDHGRVLEGNGGASRAAQKRGLHRRRNGSRERNEVERSDLLCMSLRAALGGAAIYSICHCEFCNANSVVIAHFATKTCKYSSLRVLLAKCCLRSNLAVDCFIRSQVSKLAMTRGRQTALSMFFADKFAMTKLLCIAEN